MTPARKGRRSPMKITHVESFRVPVAAPDPPFPWRDRPAGSAPARAAGAAPPAPHPAVRRGPRLSPPPTAPAPPGESRGVAVQAIALGSRGPKRPAGGDARRDAALARAVRDHVGPEFPLMYDGSAGFDLPDARYLGHALTDAGYLWY